MEDLIGAIDRAVYETVHRYVDPVSRQRGAVALATRLGLQPGTLSNKANPLQEAHQLNLRESIPLQLAADDFTILHAFASALGHCAYRLPLEDKPQGDIELLNAYTDFHARVGDKANALRRALIDGNVSRAELSDIRKHMDGAIRAGLQLLARLEVLAG